MIKKMTAAVILTAVMLVPAGVTTEAKTTSNKDFKVCQTVKVGPDRQVRNIFYMYSVKGGSYWLEPTSKVENVIWVDDASLKSWGLNKSKLHHGNIGRGTFDRTGWELLRIR